MMSFEIEKASLIKNEELDQRNYFTSLIKKALEIELIDYKLISKLQLQLIELLKIKIDKYNNFNSTSINTDTAKSIMESNIYTIGIYLKKLMPEKAIEALQHENIVDIYERGRNLIKRKIVISKLWYQKILKNLITTENETYNNTIIKGITAFFKLYDPDYNAKDIKITADYPLYNNITGKLDGIEFIEKYLKSLYYENEFCKKVANLGVEKILEQYSKDYKNLIINIFQIVLVQIIGQKLLIESQGNNLTSIYDLLKNKSKQEIYNLIFSAYKNLKIVNKEMSEYIEKGLVEIQAEIYNGVKIKKLDMIFVNIK